MPPERIGIIPLLHDGRYAPPSVTDPIEVALKDFSRSKIAVKPEELQPVIRVSKKAAADRYLEYLLHRLSVPIIRSKRFRVLVDCANGTTGETARALFQQLGCEVVGLNMKPKPNPHRDSECRAESCEEAIARTRSSKCHAGFAYDGDGDRLLVIDEQGQAMSMDVVGAILAHQYLPHGGICVATINTSGLLTHVCRGQKDVELVYCPIGQPLTGEAIIKHRPFFACEPNSGKYAVCQKIPWYDAVFISALLLEVMAQTDQPLSWFARSFPPFFQASAKLPVSAEQKEAVFRRARELLLEHSRRHKPRVSEMDGVRLDFEDASWLLIRMSGTEPVARVYSDARSQESADALRDIGHRCFERALAEAT